MLLPLVDAPKEPRTAEAYTPETIPKGSESIFVVDDDAGLLEMETEMLEHLGYRVQ